MSESSSNRNDRLDLGLSELLLSAAEPPPPAVQRAEPSSTGSPADNTAESEQSRSPFVRLKEGGRWQELIAIAERSLTGQNGSESSLWWVRGHLGALSMPVSLLIAPFERVARELAAKPVVDETRSVLEETAALMLERLQQVGQREQVLSFQAMLQELKLATVSGELGKHRHSWTLSAEPSRPEAGGPPPLPGQVPQAARRRGPRLAIVLVGLLFFVGSCLALWEIRSSLFSTPTALAFEGFVRESSLPEQEQAAVIPRDPVGDLNALFYSIEPNTPNTSAGSPGLSNSAQSAQQANDSASGGGVQVANSAPAATGSAPKPKDRVDTSGPIEGQEYRSGVDRSGARPGVTDPQLPSAGGPSRKQPRSPFDPQSGETVYRVVARVNVVATPSYRGTVIGRLQPGDEVLVDGRSGAWLKLRSRRGNEGFILAQDAEVVEGKSADDLR